MKVVILAGGKGTRLYPLTITTPKSMLPVGSKPVIEHLVTCIPLLGFRDFIITVNYLKQQIMNHLCDGSKFGINIQYIVEPDNYYLGTAGSVMLAKDQLTETFVIFQGDAFTEIDVRKPLEFHRKKGGDVTIVLKAVSDPWLYGVSMLDENSRIIGFQERPPKQECKSNLVSTGIYILEPHVLDFVGEGNVDFARDIFPRLIASDRKIFGYITDDFWVDIGSREGYLLANRRATDREYNSSELEIDETSRIISPVYIEENVKIGMFCVIGPYVTLKRGVRVKEGSLIRDSIIFEDAVISPGCRIEASIIDKLVTLDSRSVVKEAVLGKQTQAKRSRYFQL